jgi:hypothetical protein
MWKKITSESESYKKPKKQKRKTQQDKVHQKKTYNLKVNYLFALATNNWPSSSSSRMTMFLLQPATVHNELCFHFSRMSFYSSFF